MSSAVGSVRGARLVIWWGTAGVQLDRHSTYLLDAIHGDGGLLGLMVS